MHYRQEIYRASAITTATGLEAALARRPDDRFGEERMAIVRDAILHAMTETATHAGHLGAARESVNGRMWLVMSE